MLGTALPNSGLGRICETWLWLQRYGSCCSSTELFSCCVALVASSRVGAPVPSVARCTEVHIYIYFMLVNPSALGGFVVPCNFFSCVDASVTPSRSCAAAPLVATYTAVENLSALGGVLVISKQKAASVLSMVSPRGCDSYPLWKLIVYIYIYICRSSWFSAPSVAL